VAILRGSISGDFFPRIKITVRNPSNGAERGLDPVIDTGFTGFLLMPLEHAFSLGLDGRITIPVVLGDSTVRAYSGTIVQVSVSNSRGARGVGLFKKEETKDQGKGSDCFVGIQFIRIFGPMFVLSNDAVALADEEDAENVASVLDFDPVKF